MTNITIDEVDQPLVSEVVEVSVANITMFLKCITIYRINYLAQNVPKMIIIFYTYICTTLCGRIKGKAGIQM